MADLLEIRDLRAGYGSATVLSGVSFRLGQGQSIALLGRNGTGKTTLINTLVGVTTYRGGEIMLDGQSLVRRSPEARAHLGIGWVPQERNIFRSLTVEENLTAVARPGAWTVERVYGMFPRLKERRGNMGNQLSGGEQQMLAVARALMLNPKVLLLDEPLEGLAPIIVDELLAALRRIVRNEGTAAIVVEQKARKILAVTDRAIVLERGAIVHEGPSAELAGDASRLEAHLGVAKGKHGPRSREYAGKSP
ncbi:MAG TPA: ABC transporter ATP-binding protein [Rhizobiaceae bacterium]|nr:ABC transporter ATP-binding protein [Rhizobiaceae bacterium]